MSVSIPANLLSAAQAASANLWQVLVSIALNESSDGSDGDYTTDGVHFYPASEAPAGSWPTSFGPLQLHTPGGLGDGYAISQLRNWTTNFQIGANYLQGRLNAGASLYDALAPWSTRDADYALWQRIQTEGVNGGAPTSTPPAPASTVNPPAAKPSLPNLPSIPGLPPLPSDAVTFGIVGAVVWALVEVL